MDMYKRFMEAFGKLPDDVRKAYLLRVFEEGMAKRWAKAERSQPAQLRDAQPQFAIADRSRSRSSGPASSSYQSMISLPGGNSAVPGEIEQRVRVARRARRARESGATADASQSEGATVGMYDRGSDRTKIKQGRGVQMTAPLVNYGSGMRQKRHGGARTIQGVAPILEFSEAADDPYVMRPKVQ